MHRTHLLRDVTDLTVYTRSMELSADVWALAMEWSNFARWTVGKQLVRSAGSVPANLCEAFGRVHRREQLWFLQIARASAKETQCWLAQAKNNRLISPERWTSYDDRTVEVVKMLSGLTRSLRTNNATK